MSAITVTPAAADPGPGGGAAISTPKVIYIETNGDDATAEIGNPAKPYLTANTAYMAGLLTGDDYVMRFGVGQFTLDIDTWSVRCRTIYGCGAGVSSYIVEATAATGLTIRSLWLAANPAPIENAYGNSGVSVYDAEFHDIYLKANLQGQSVTSTDSNIYDGGNGGEFKARCFGARLEVNCLGGGSNNGNAGFNASVTVEGCGWVMVAGEGGIITLDGGDIRGAAISYTDSFRMARCARMDGLNNPTSDLGGNAVY